MPSRDSTRRSSRSPRDVKQARKLAPPRNTGWLSSRAPLGVRELRRRLEAAQTLLAERAHLVSELTNHREELQAQNEMLVKAERELWLARDALTDLYELAPIPYLTLTGATVISAVNLAASRFLGGGKASMLGKPFAMFVALADRQRFRRHIAACRRSGGVTSVELTLLAPGEAAAVQLSSTLSQNGWIYTAVVDLRERQRAETERRELAVKAEAARVASQAKDEFLATLSHELRTPLTPVTVAVSALERACADAGIPNRELFATLHRNLGHEVRLIDDLLDVTRLAHGKLSMESQLVDLHAIVHEAAEQVRAIADGKGVRLGVELRAARHHVRGDADRLRQVFANLLRNGIKFTPPRGRLVTVASQTHGNRVTVEVRDAGMGIAPQDHARIFDRFAQGSTTGSRDGLGLGLAIARDIVQAHGGEIGVDSAGQGLGAAFHVRLACVAAKRVAVTTQPRSAPVVPAAASGTSKRILFVEDHSDTASVMAMVLQQAGHRVTLAESVTAALAHAQDPIDVVISDIGLPDGSGLDLMRQLRAQRPLPGIALSGYGTDEDIDRSREAGFQQHFVKPVDLLELLRAIEELTRPPEAPARVRKRALAPVAIRRPR